MADNYIEKDDTSSEFFNTASKNFKFCDGHSSSESIDENLDKSCSIFDWSLLESSWDKMNNTEKYAMFIPYYHYIRPRNYTPDNLDSAINSNILETSLKLCRLVSDINYDPDHQGVPTIIVKYAPIDTKFIKNDLFRSKVEMWAKSVGLI